MSGHDLLAVIAERHCQRSFLDREVPRELLVDVLAAARHAPSTRNTQMWRVEVVTGAARRTLADRLLADFDDGVPTRHDYVNRPPEMESVFEERARAAGMGVLRAKGIARDDAAGRNRHLRDNFDFYGAPVALIVHLPGNAQAGTFLETGMFVQNVMLGLVARGLGSCPQYSVTGYSDTIRRALGLSDDRLIVCGMSVGYPQPDAPVNHFVPERAPVDGFATWHGWE